MATPTTHSPLPVRALADTGDALMRSAARVGHIVQFFWHVLAAMPVIQVKYRREMSRLITNNT